MSRRPRIPAVVALVAAMLVTLVACSSSSSKKKANAAEVKLRIGVLFTTSGEGGDLAQAVLGATKLAADDAKKDKVTIEIVQADYAGDPKLVGRAVQSLQGKTDAVIVATPDPVVLPAVAAITDVPVIHTLLTEDGINETENVFSIAPSTTLQAEKLADYLVNVRKYRKIAVITDRTAYGRDGKDAVERALGDLGIRPRLSTDFVPGGDIHTPVAHAGQLNVDAAIVWVFNPSEAARIVVEEQKMGFGYQVALSGNLATSTFAKNASAQVTPVAFRDGMLSVGTWAGPWFNVGRIVDFYTRFQSENSAQAPVQAATFYDAVALLAKAARNAGGVTGSDLITGIKRISDFEGVGVPLTFGTDDHEGVDLDDLGIYGFTKDQDSAGGEFFPDVDTGGGFFTIVTESLELPQRYRFLTTRI